MDTATAAPLVWPDWFRIALDGHPSAVAHLLPAGLAVTLCELAFAPPIRLLPVRRRDRRCAHCAKAARRRGLLLPRRD